MAQWLHLCTPAAPRAEPSAMLSIARLLHLCMQTASRAEPAARCSIPRRAYHCMLTAQRAATWQLVDKPWSVKRALVHADGAGSTGSVVAVVVYATAAAVPLHAEGGAPS